MKTKMLILLVVSAASLSGCMVYPGYGHGHGGSRGDSGPTYIYGDSAGRRDESDNRGEHRRRSDDEHGDRDSGNSRR
jgi:hypothetical protein